MTLFESGPSWPRPSPQRSRRTGRQVAVFWIVLAPLCVATLVLGLSALPSGAPSNTMSNTMSPEMQRIAERIGFSDEGQAIFSRASPQLLDSAEFTEICASPEKTDGVTDGQLFTLGCYVDRGTSFGQIAIFRPGDDRLADQAVIVAAHEFLHAAYATLTIDDRVVLDPLLESRWSLIPPDDPLQANLAYSVGTVSENRATEQFAYLGTEIADAGDPTLEAYYAPYFVDRQALVAVTTALHAMREGLWADLQAKADALLVHEQSDADAGAQLQADREYHDADVAVHNTQVNEYNALPPHVQARQFVMNADGGLGDEAWGSYLARHLEEITSRQTAFIGRQEQLDASVAAALVERAAVEALETDLRALDASGVPAITG